MFLPTGEYTRNTYKDLLKETEGTNVNGGIIDYFSGFRWMINPVKSGV